MAQGTLLPNHFEVKLICLRPKDGAIQMELQACRTFSSCPTCGTTSRRVHSRYTRRLGDLPWEGLPVRILLYARKFFCVGEGCHRRVFTEPLPGSVLRAMLGGPGGRLRLWTGSLWLWEDRQGHAWPDVLVCSSMVQLCCARCDVASSRHRLLVHASLESMIGCRFQNYLS
jgi:hypothetical protein